MGCRWRAIPRIGGISVPMRAMRGPATGRQYGAVDDAILRISGISILMWAMRAGDWLPVRRCRWRAIPRISGIGVPMRAMRGPATGRQYGAPQAGRGRQPGGSGPISRPRGLPPMGSPSCAMPPGTAPANRWRPAAGFAHLSRRAWPALDLTIGNLLSRPGCTIDNSQDDSSAGDRRDFRPCPRDGRLRTKRQDDVR